MITRRPRKDIEIFNFSFLDILACTIGALIFILVMALLQSSGVLHAVQITSDIKQLEKTQSALQTEVAAAQEAAKRADDDLQKLEGERPALAQEIDSYVEDTDREKQRSTQLSQEKAEQKKNLDEVEAQYAEAALRLENLEKQKKAALNRPKRAVPIAEADGKGTARTPIHVDCRYDRIIIHGEKPVEVLVQDIDAPGSPYRELVKRVNDHKDKESIVLWVRPDGRNTFKRAKELCAEEEMKGVGWEPADGDWKLSAAESPLTLYAGKWKTTDEIEMAKADTQRAIELLKREDEENRKKEEQEKQKRMAERRVALAETRKEPARTEDDQQAQIKALLDKEAQRNAEEANALEARQRTSAQEAPDEQAVLERLRHRGAREITELEEGLLAKRERGAQGDADEQVELEAKLKRGRERAAKEVAVTEDAWKKLAEESDKMAKASRGFRGGTGGGVGAGTGSGADDGSGTGSGGGIGGGTGGGIGDGDGDGVDKLKARLDAMMKGTQQEIDDLQAEHTRTQTRLRGNVESLENAQGGGGGGGNRGSGEGAAAGRTGDGDISRLQAALNGNSRENDEMATALEAAQRRTTRDAAESAETLKAKLSRQTREGSEHKDRLAARQEQEARTNDESVRALRNRQKKANQDAAELENDLAARQQLEREKLDQQTKLLEEQNRRQQKAADRDAALAAREKPAKQERHRKERTADERPVKKDVQGQGKQMIPKEKKRTDKRRFREEQKQLLSLDSKFQRDLDSKNISKELRQRFQSKGISLSNNSIVSIEKKDNRWLITDKNDMRAYTIRKEQGRLNVYRGN